VRKEGRRKLEPTTFEVFAREWLATYPDTKDLKRSTTEGYRSIIEGHLIPELGQLQLPAVDVAQLDRYLTKKRAEGLAPRTLNRHLNLLHSLLKAAEGRGLVRSNPVSAVERPREPRRRWTILSPVEVARVERAFVDLVNEAKGEERAWREQARVVFLTVVSDGGRALVVGHSPTNEAAVLGLSGEIVAPLAKGAGALVVAGTDGYSVQPLE